MKSAFSKTVPLFPVTVKEFPTKSLVTSTPLQSIVTIYYLIMLSSLALALYLEPGIIKIVLFLSQFLHLTAKLTSKNEKLITLFDYLYFLLRWDCDLFGEQLIAPTALNLTVPLTIFWHLYWLNILCTCKNDKRK